MRTYQIHTSRHAQIQLQSTLVISKSKGPSKSVRDIRTSTYQICSIEEKTIWTTKFYKWLCNLTPLNRNIYWKYCGKGRNCSQEQFLLFSTIFYNLILDFCVITRTRLFLRDKRLFEITEVEITRVDCIWMWLSMYSMPDRCPEKTCRNNVLESFFKFLMPGDVLHSFVIHWKK